MTAVTEAQKKQIMILLSAFLTIIIYIAGIRPMQEQIKSNEVRLESIKSERQQMQDIVDDKSIETNYVKLRDEYETKFQMRFKSFNINEKVEAVTKEMGIPIVSMKIKDFEPVSKTVYENYVAQPKTAEELEQVRTDEKSPVFSLLLSAQVDLSLGIDNIEDELKMYDAFNNIVPVGPGDGDPDRYCLLLPQTSIKHLSQGNNRNSTGDTVSCSIYVFAMETMDLTEWDAEFEARK